MKPFKKLVLLFFLTTAFQYSCFADTIIINDASLKKIGKSLSVFEDKKGTKTIDEIISPQLNSKFKKSTQDIPNLGVTKSAYWIRFDAINNSKEEIYLKIDNCNLGQIDLYKLENNNILSAIHSGSILNFRSRQVKNNFYLFSILKGDETGSITFLIRLKYDRGLQFPIRIGSLKEMMEVSHRNDFIQGIYFGIMIIMLVYNLILYFSIRDKTYLFYVFYVFTMGLLNAELNGYAFEYLWPGLPELNKYGDVVSCMAGIAGLLFATNFLNTLMNTPRLHKVFQIILLIYFIILPLIFSGNFLLSSMLMEFVTLVLITLFFITAIRILRHGYKPARFFLIAWSLLLISVVIFIMKDYNIIPNNVFTENSMQFGSAIEAALLSLAMANKINLYKKEKEIAQEESLRMLKANRKLILEQNIILEEKVESRTHELKETQIHLMRQEKLASLGQLTAGIAHEIKNPLNFVNNFSDVSGELVDEIKLAKTEFERNEILSNLKNNLRKISLHGKQADTIVDSMLKHSKYSIGGKQITDIHKLCDEYFEKSFNGIKISYPDFNCKMVKHFESEMTFVKVSAFDIARVMLNVFNNAFHAVKEKIKRDENYSAVVSLSITNTRQLIIIRVKDNGIGIPDNQRDKIFNPFFTTKPAGQGTGLGLSLSYDIIISHGGDMRLENSLNEETEFVIELPITV